MAYYWFYPGPGNTFFCNKFNGEGIFLHDISLNQNIIGNETKAFTDEKNVASKSILHGNIINNHISWTPGISDNLPLSLYLLVKPDFFGSKNWSAFGPDVTQKNKLPAQEQFESDHPTVLPEVPAK